MILFVRLRSRFGLKLPGWVGEGDELKGGGRGVWGGGNAG